MAYLYRHIRLDKNEPFYIGIGSDETYERAYSKNRTNKHWINIVNSIDYEVEILLDNLSWEEACKKETEFIQIYGRIDLNTGTLVNLTDGGEGTINRIVSNETKSKMSKSATGKKLSDSTKEKLSKINSGENNSYFGKKHSVEVREKISKKLTGKKLSEEHRKKSRETLIKAGKNSSRFAGRKHSEETKRKMREAQLGKKFTDEHRKNMSESHKGKTPWNKK